MESLDALRIAAGGLARHPQDHGWRRLYALIAAGLESDCPALAHLLERVTNDRPHLSASHVITLLGMGLKNSLPKPIFEELLASQPEASGMGLLEQAIVTAHGQLLEVMHRRQNSFTSARRFLVPQVILSSIFRGPKTQCVFADLGTGIGVMPRQLNAERVYTTFSDDLVWPRGQPAFTRIAITRRYGLDRPPLPDLDWIRSCYGSSSYYDRLLEELIWCLGDSDVARNAVEYIAVDLLDYKRLRDILVSRRMNVANLSYVLYELDKPSRERVTETVLESLAPPAVVITTEPRGELAHQGADVNIYMQGSRVPWHFATVSDGHFSGELSEGADYEQFTKLFPIHLERRT